MSNAGHPDPADEITQDLRPRMPTQPTTAVGRALLAYELATGADGIEAERVISDLLGRHWEQRDAILAIEAEAREEGWQSHPSYAHGYKKGRAAALDEARPAVEHEMSGWSPGFVFDPAQKAASIRLALAAIDALREDADKT